MSEMVHHGLSGHTKGLEDECEYCLRKERDRYRKALEKIVARKLEDIPGNHKRDEFYKTLMATAAWVYCGFIAQTALAQTEGK